MTWSNIFFLFLSCLFIKLSRDLSKCYLKLFTISFIESWNIFTWPLRFYYFEIIFLIYFFMRSTYLSFFSMSSSLDEFITDSEERIFLLRFYLLLKLWIFDIYLRASLVELVRVFVLILSSRFEEDDEESCILKWPIYSQ